MKPRSAGYVRRYAPLAGVSAQICSLATPPTILFHRPEMEKQNNGY